MFKDLFIKIKEWFTNNSELAITVTFILLLFFAFFDAAAASAAAVGFCAFLATYWQAKISREHNKLSVEPKIEFEVIRDPQKPITIGIINNGLGPAILDEIILIIKGNEYIYAKKETQSELDWLCRNEGLTYKPIILLKNSSLPVNIKYDLITFTNSIENEILHRNANELIGEALNFKFKYKSMYGDERDVKLFITDSATEKNK